MSQQPYDVLPNSGLPNSGWRNHGWLSVASLVIGCAVLLYLGIFWSNAGDSPNHFGPSPEIVLALNAAGFVLGVAGVLTQKRHIWAGIIGIILNAAPALMYVFAVIKAIASLFGRGH